MIFSAKLEINRYLTISRNLCSSLNDIRKGILEIASNFEGSVLIPSDEIMCPKNVIHYFVIWYLVLFSFKPLSLIFKKTLLRRSSCFSKVFPHTTLSLEFALLGMSEIIEVTSI